MDTDKNQNPHSENGPENGFTPPPPQYESNIPGPNLPGQGAATASMVLGIISVVLWFFGYSSLVSIILGVIGLVLASNSKNAGFNGSTRTAGFVLSLIGLIGGALFFIACIACMGSIAAYSSIY